MKRRLRFQPLFPLAIYSVFSKLDYSHSSRSEFPLDYKENSKTLSPPSCPHPDNEFLMKRPSHSTQLLSLWFLFPWRQLRACAHWTFTPSFWSLVCLSSSQALGRSNFLLQKSQSVQKQEKETGCYKKFQNWVPEDSTLNVLFMTQ